MTAMELRFLRLSIGLTIAVMAFSPVSCSAATAALPWDQTLIALQDALVTDIAPAAIGLALSGAIVLYVLGGRDQQAGRLLGSALGGCVALAVVKLVNYLLP
jgi:hypothetical protein